MSHDEFLSEVGELEKQVFSVVNRLDDIRQVDKELLKKANRDLNNSFDLLKIVITNADLDRAIV